VFAYVAQRLRICEVAAGGGKILQCRRRRQFGRGGFGSPKSIKLSQIHRTAYTVLCEVHFYLGPTGISGLVKLCYNEGNYSFAMTVL